LCILYYTRGHYQPNQRVNIQTQIKKRVCNAINYISSYICINYSYLIYKDPINLFLRYNFNNLIFDDKPTTLIFMCSVEDFFLGVFLFRTCITFSSQHVIRICVQYLTFIFHYPNPFLYLFNLFHGWLRKCRTSFFFALAARKFCHFGAFLLFFTSSFLSLSFFFF